MFGDFDLNKAVVVEGTCDSLTLVGPGKDADSECPGVTIRRIDDLNSRDSCDTTDMSLWDDEVTALLDLLDLCESKQVDHKVEIIRESNMDSWITIAWYGREYLIIVQVSDDDLGLDQIVIGRD